MFRGSFGVSYNISKDTPISQLIQNRLPISIAVGGMAVALGAIVGLILGIVAALKHNTFWDTLCTIISVIGVSIPSYVFALGLSYTFGFRLKWLPMLYATKEAFASSILPSIALSLFTLASIARFTRTEMLEVLGSDYMGHLVETGSKDEIFSNPVHPYTQSLLSAIPVPNPRTERTRIAKAYSCSESGIDYNAGTQHHLGGGHYVLATDEELAKWTK